MTNGNSLRHQLESLLLKEVSPEQFYGTYLKTLGAALPGVQGFHLWVSQGVSFSPLGGSDLRVLDPGGEPVLRERFYNKFSECSSSQRTVVVPPENGTAAPTLAFTPLLFGSGQGAVQGAQLSWWQVPAGSGLRPEFLAALDDCGRVAAKMVRAQKLESMAQVSDRLQMMTSLLDELGGAPDLDALTVAIANRAREMCSCDRSVVMVLTPDGGPKVRAISSVLFPDPRSSVVRTLSQLGENALARGLPAAYRKAGEKTAEKGDLSDYFFHSNMEETVLVGIGSKEKPDGILVVESSKIGHFDGETRNIANAVALHSAGPLRRAIEIDRLPALGLMKRLAAWRSKPRAERRKFLMRYVWIPAVILLGILFFPVPIEISGEARLVPAQRAMVIAEVPGRLLELLVSDGDVVTAGQPLARLDSSDLQRQLDITEQEAAKQRAEVDGLEVNDEMDRAGARVAQLGLQRVMKERDYLVEQIERSTLKSPMAGIIIAPGLSSRKGEAFTFGTQLAMIGDPASWELEILIGEGDAAPIFERLSKGPVPVRYVLAALPNRSFETRVTSPEEISSSAEVIGTRNVFHVVVPADLPADDAAMIRSGFSGRAKLQADHRPLLVAATRRFFNWFQTHVLF